jgi:hypothetical protein
VTAAAQCGSKNYGVHRGGAETKEEVHGKSVEVYLVCSNKIVKGNPFLFYV